MNIGRNTGRLHGLLLCCLVTGGVLAGDGDTGVAPTPARQLGEALVAQGWDVRPVADGSQIYRRPEDAGEARAAAPAAPQETPSTTPAEQLRGALLDQGWHTRPGDDGSVFYLPPVSPPRAVETPSEQLREQLERQGWVGSTAADGSTLYRRPVTPAAPVPVPGVGSDSLAGRLRAELEGRGWDAAPAEDGGVYYFPPPPRVEVPASLAEGLRRQLEAQGWVSSTDDQGNTLYRAPGVTESHAPQGSLANQLRQTLEQRGWVAVPTEDGDVHYLPPHWQAPTPPAQDVQPTSPPGPGSERDDGSREPVSEAAPEEAPAAASARAQSEAITQPTAAAANTDAPAATGRAEVPPSPAPAAAVAEDGPSQAFPATAMPRRYPGPHAWPRGYGTVPPGWRAPPWGCHRRPTTGTADSVSVCAGRSKRGLTNCQGSHPLSDTAAAPSRADATSLGFLADFFNPARRAPGTWQLSIDAFPRPVLPTSARSAGDFSRRAGRLRVPSQIFSPNQSHGLTGTEVALSGAPTGVGSVPCRPN